MSGAQALGGGNLVFSRFISDNSNPNFEFSNFSKKKKFSPHGVYNHFKAYVRNFILAVKGMENVKYMKQTENFQNFLFNSFLNDS